MEYDSQQSNSDSFESAKILSSLSETTQPEMEESPESGKQAEAIDVGMKEWAKNTPDSPVLKTRGLGPCIGIASYSPENHIGHMAHIAVPMLEQSTVEDFLGSIQATAEDAGTIKIWVRGGQLSAEMAKSLVDMPQIGRDFIISKLSELGLPEENIDIQWDEAEMGGPGTKMMLDTATGVFTSKK